MKKIIKEDEFQEMQPSSEPLNRSLARYKNIPVILLVVWSTVMVPLFMPNMGGTGLALPQNIVAWIMIVIIIGMTMAMLPGRHQLLVTSSWRYAALAVAILALPLCFTHAEWLEHAEWRQLGLTGGLIFWLALLQWRWSTRQRQWVMYGLLFSAALQALAVLCQLSGLPVAHRIPYPYQLGVFQQRNLLASFWAVGLGLALGMFLSPAYRWRRYEHVRQAGLLSLLWLLSALLTLQQSRTGWLSAGVIVIWGILLFARRHPARAALAFGFITAGILLAIYLIYAGHTVSYQSHLHSNLARISMYRDD